MIIAIYVLTGISILSCLLFFVLENCEIIYALFCFQYRKCYHFSDMSLMMRMWHPGPPELGFLPHLNDIVVDVMTSGSPHVLKLWFEVCMGILLVK